jgi:hypothetical protein
VKGFVVAKPTWSVSGNKVIVIGDYSGYGALLEIVAAALGERFEIADVDETSKPIGAIITVRNKRKDDSHNGPSKKR